MKTKKPSVKNKVKKYEWVEREPAIVMGRKLSNGSVLGYGNSFFISYQPNERAIVSREDSDLDSANPETAIVIKNDKKMYGGTMRNRYLIYRGDYRKELEKLYPDLDKLKEHWKKYGGHFWSDNLDD